jgi:hypothetical protein
MGVARAQEVDLRINFNEAARHSYRFSQVRELYSQAGVCPRNAWEGLVTLVSVCQLEAAPKGSLHVRSRDYPGPSRRYPEVLCAETLRPN